MIFSKICARGGAHMKPIHFHEAGHMLDKRKALKRDLHAEGKALWLELQGKKLGVKFSHRPAVCGHIPMFWCTKGRLIVEVVDIPADPERDTRLFEEYGIRTLRFSRQEVREDLSAVLAMIREALTGA